MQEIAAKQESSAQASTVVIEKLGSGWYSFENVPQETHYIKVHALCCGTDRKAMNQAKKINPNRKYVIREVKA